MSLLNLAFTSLGAAAFVALFALPAHATDTFSDADQRFVAKVSQGGTYEVKLGTLAETKATSQLVKDEAKMEVHDHKGVNEKLDDILRENGWAFPAFSPKFQARLDKMNALPADKFDAAYIADMKQIHVADGAAFAKEASGGTNPDLKSFAAETYLIVKRHQAELNKS